MDQMIVDFREANSAILRSRFDMNPHVLFRLLKGAELIYDVGPFPTVLKAHQCTGEHGHDLIST